MFENPNSAVFEGTLRKSRWSYKLWMLMNSRELFFEELIRKYGDFVDYRGLINFHLVNHPALVKQVLQQTHDSFDKNSPLYDRFRQAFGKGLVVAEGKPWKKQRGVIQQLMGPRHVQTYFGLMIDSVEEIASVWQSRCGQAIDFDISSDMDQLTLSIIGRALFQDRFDESFDLIRHWTHVIDHYSSKAPLPIIRSPWFPSTLNYRLKITLREFRRFIHSMIDEFRQQKSKSGLLSLLCHQDKDSDSEQLSDEEICDEVLGMIVGGHETSSVALIWAWYELSQNPEVEERLHAELKEVLGDDPITHENASKLTYTRMVIDETLRLHPPFWFENRNVMKEVQLGGELLRPGEMVAFSRYALHRHPDFWNDPDKFDPERFRPDSEENKRSTYAYVPFGGGPRTCVGIHFAVQELIVLLASLARRFKIEVAQDYQHEISALLTMRPKHGLRVRVSRH